MRCAFIYEHRDVWPISTQCRVLKVSRGGYYQWLQREPSPTAEKQTELVTEMKRIHALPKHDTYGSPRMYKTLIANGFTCSENTVARLMRHNGMRASIGQTFRVTTTDSKHDLPIAPNRLDQCFIEDSLNRVWLTDFTYIPCQGKFIYLCCVLDLCSRKIVGWATSRHIDAALALAALRMALALREPPKGLIVHSDRGSQFASADYRQCLDEHDCLQSMSRKGNCYDNAPQESFFKSFKVEEVYQRKYESYEDVTRAVADYIERFYNRLRLHSSLNYVSPVQFEEQRFRETQVV